MVGVTLCWMMLIGSPDWDLQGLLPEDTPTRIAESCVDSAAAEREICVALGLRELVGGMGYLEATVETTQVGTAPTLRLVPGRRYQLDRMVIDGVHHPASERALQHALSMQGSAWDGRELSRRLERIVEAYEDDGYPFASVSVRHVSVDGENALLSLRVGVREGPHTVIESIQVSEGAKTKPRVIARLAGLRPGMVYSQRIIDMVDDRLLKTGYYASVSEPKLIAGTTPERIKMEIGVVERSTHSARGSVGLSQDGKVAGSIDLDLRNIAGTAREVRLAWASSGTGRSDLLLAYTEPWLFGLPPALTLEVRQTVEDTLWVERSGRVGLAWNLGRGFTGSLGYSTKRVIPGENVFGIESSRTNEGWGQATWDRLQRIGLHESGYSIRIWSAYQQRKNLETGHEVPVVPIELDMIRHVHVSRRTSVGLRGAWRQLITSEDEVPLPEQYPLGGARSLRGYREKQFRSRVIGWLNGEYGIFPDQRASVFFFVDAGMFREGDSWETRIGFGPGTRFETTLGIMELEYGIPQNVGILDGRIHLALGRAF